MKPGCVAAEPPLLLQSASQPQPSSINKPITHSARLGCIYVDLNWGTSEGIINRHTGLLSQPPLLGGRKGAGPSAQSPAHPD